MNLGYNYSTMRITEFYADSPNWVKINQQELDNPNPPSRFGIVDLPDYIEIKRVITFREIRRYLSEIHEMGEVQLHISDLKYSHILADSQLLSSLGYDNIELLDIAPGDISISYILRAKRKDIV